MPRNRPDHYLKRSCLVLSKSRGSAYASAGTETGAKAARMKSIASPYRLIRPPAIILQPLRNFGKYRLQQIRHNKTSQDAYSSNPSRNCPHNASSYSENSCGGTTEPINLSFVSQRPVTPYIALKGINELYEALQEKHVKDSPFVKGGGKEKAFSFLDFIDFSYDKWVESATGPSPRERRKRKGVSLLPIISVKKASEDSRSSGMSPTTNPKRAQKVGSFEEYAKLFREKKRHEGKKAAIDVDQLKRAGVLPMIEEVLNPTESELDMVGQTRAACKDFYLRKRRMREDVVKKLDAMGSERPYAAKVKKLCLAMRPGANVGQKSLAEELSMCR